MKISLNISASNIFEMLMYVILKYFHFLIEFLWQVHLAFLQNSQIGNQQNLRVLHCIYRILFVFVQANATHIVISVPRSILIGVVLFSNRVLAISFGDKKRILNFKHQIVAVKPELDSLFVSQFDNIVGIIQF